MRTLPTTQDFTRLKTVECQYSTRSHRITETVGPFPRLPPNSFGTLNLCSKHYQFLVCSLENKCAIRKGVDALQKLSLLPSVRPRRQGENHSGYPREDLTVGSGVSAWRICRQWVCQTQTQSPILILPHSEWPLGQQC